MVLSIQYPVKFIVYLPLKWTKRLQAFLKGPYLRCILPTFLQQIVIEIIKEKWKIWRRDFPNRFHCQPASQEAVGWGKAISEMHPEAHRPTESAFQFRPMTFIAMAVSRISKRQFKTPISGKRGWPRDWGPIAVCDYIRSFHRFAIIAYWTI